MAHADPAGTGALPVGTLPVAPGSFVTDVPYDPDLYFTGEEITLAVRAYTHGYDFFHPRQVIVWHEYTRNYREHKHWTDHTTGPEVELPWHQRDQASLAKVAAFSSIHAGAPSTRHRPRLPTTGLRARRDFAQRRRTARQGSAAPTAGRPGVGRADPLMRARPGDREGAAAAGGLDDHHFW
ncbi:MAG: GlcNAc-transferase family protein [Vicinamibacterales bacterium]